jgi:D-alanyl-D-alanine carboxypeptidase
MRGNRRRIVSGSALAIVLAMSVPAGAATALVDVESGDVLEATDTNERVALGRTADLLLIALLAHHAHGGTMATEVPMHVVEPDPGPVLTRQPRATLAELVQVLLLTDSRTAARTLAAALGDDTLAARFQSLCRTLRLDGTAVSGDATRTPTSFPVGVTGTTNVLDVARLAGTLLDDAAIHRRIGLDGVPVAGGAVIVRATAPLIATRPPADTIERGNVVAPAGRGGTIREPSTRAQSGAVGPTIAVAGRDGLELLAVATGPDAVRVWDVLERGFARYRRVLVVEAGAQVERAVEVHGGILPAFNPKAAETFAVTARRGETPTVALSLQLPPILEAPVDLNQRVGELVIERDGRVLGLVPLVAPMTIAPSRWLDTATRDARPR